MSGSSAAGRRPGRRAGAVRSSGRGRLRGPLGCLVGVAAVVLVLAVGLTVFVLVTRATRNEAPGTALTGTISRDVDVDVTMTFRSLDRATEAQADAWGRAGITNANTPADGEPYVAVVDVAIPAGATIAEDDWDLFAWTGRHGEDGRAQDVTPTRDATVPDGCVIDRAALTAALDDRGSARYCALIRSDVEPEAVAYGWLYRESGVGRRGTMSATTTYTPRWDVGDVGVWSGSAR
ncbi:hypothetical protein BIU98_16875 [Curtobacterium sp. MMLR14_010]|uniref:hypothetical protein n=1 Tax=Curtobacterium sp. MMLR14_010 TaxID=1898743 RepID=UPI0008DC75A4|nr:hypothetical protein [Curtobacterium sp. MMLR14_010]OII37121.1 hypothetical protein BIU98_16875 [Curtobacterium sp. MMLR14_010]